MPRSEERQKISVKSKVYCVSCKKPVQGKPSVMRLQITHKNARMIECAKKVGFTSPTGIWEKRCKELCIGNASTKPC